MTRREKLVESYDRVDGSGHIEIWVEHGTENIFTKRFDGKGRMVGMTSTDGSKSLAEVREQAVTWSNMIMLTE